MSIKANFSTQHLSNVFAEEGKYESFRKLCYDLNHGNEIFEYDEESGVTRPVSKHDANRAIRRILMEVAEISEEDLKSNKTWQRKLSKHEDEIFELIEEDIEFKVETGLRENDWFQDYIEYRNIKLGDDEEFWIREATGLFVVAKISGDHHDLTMQHLAPNKPMRVHTNKYGMKIGKDIDLIILGRVDFTELTDKIAQSFAYFILQTAFTEVYASTAKVTPETQFNKTGALSQATKAKFDELIEDVCAANNSDCVIMGTKTALKQLNALADVNWISASQKESVAMTGRLGAYEGTVLIEIPQRFALNDTTTKLLSNDKLLIFPVNQEPFVKVVDKGEVRIVERGENYADLADDFKTYEVQREIGVGTMIGNYFGIWNMK